MRKVKPFKCPVCDGQCFVARPDSVPGNVKIWLTRLEDTEKYECPCCTGLGVIWPPQLNDLYLVSNIVTQTVIAIFDDLNLAKLFIEHFSDHDGLETDCVKIVEYKLNELSQNSLFDISCYCVEMLKDGSVVKCYKVYLPNNVNPVVGFNKSAMYCRVFAANKEEAINAANLSRIDLLNRYAWISGIDCHQQTKDAISGDGDYVEKINATF